MIHPETGDDSAPIDAALAEMKAEKDRQKLLVWFDPNDTRTLIINEDGDFVGLQDKSERAHELFQALEQCRKDRQP